MLLHLDRSARISASAWARDTLANAPHYVNVVALLMWRGHPVTVRLQAATTTGATGNAATGGAVGTDLPAGADVISIRCSLRRGTSGISAPVRPGSVGVLVTIGGADHSTSAATDDADWDWYSYGHVSAFGGVEWPGAPLTPTFAPGTGTMRSVTGADPAAGSEVTIVQGSGLVWRPLAGQAQLVTDATAVTRFARLLLSVWTSGTLMIHATSAAQGASLTWTYTWYAAAIAQSTFALSTQASFVEGVYLQTAGVIITSVNNLQAGDNWGPMTIQVEEWIVPAIAAS